MVLLNGKTWEFFVRNSEARGKKVSSFQSVSHHLFIMIIDHRQLDHRQLDHRQQDHHQQDQDDDDYHLVVRLLLHTR